MNVASSSTTVCLFAGDSLTEGIYGESYVERVAAALDEGWAGLGGQAINAGRSGDTVASLLDRFDGLLTRYQPQWVILAVGSNDVWFPWLTSHSLGWKLWLGYRRLGTDQVPTTDLDAFAAAYAALIDRARQAGARVLACTVSPLGERLSSPVNNRLARLNGVIKHVAAEQRVPVADVWQASVEELAALPERSGYLPGEWLFAWLDRRRFRNHRPDEIAHRRHLHLTFDGIHLNSRGADMWAATVLNALAQSLAAGAFPDMARRLDLFCFEEGALEACCTPGWEARARDLARSLTAAYEHLASLTGSRPVIRLAVLNRVHWDQSGCASPYPAPASLWDGESGTVFAPEAYDDEFLRAWRLPETVAAWTSWPPDLADLGELAQATTLADMLALQELARLFLADLRVAPTDPALGRLLAAYLAQVVLRARRGAGAARMATLWNAWGDVLARAGVEEGRVRQQARALFQEHGEGLVAPTSGQPSSLKEQVAASLAPASSDLES